MKHTKGANRNISMNKYQSLPQGNKIHMLPQNKSKSSTFAAMTITHVILCLTSLLSQMISRKCM